jgi:hypothetical protein
VGQPPSDLSVFGAESSTIRWLRGPVFVLKALSERAKPRSTFYRRSQAFPARGRPHADGQQRKDSVECVFYSLGNELRAVRSGDSLTGVKPTNARPLGKAGRQAGVAGLLSHQTMAQIVVPRVRRFNNRYAPAPDERSIVECRSSQIGNVARRSVAAVAVVGA